MLIGTVSEYNKYKYKYCKILLSKVYCITLIIYTKTTEKLRLKVDQNGT